MKRKMKKSQKIGPIGPKSTRKIFIQLEKNASNCRFCPDLADKPAIPVPIIATLLSFNLFDDIYAEPNLNSVYELRKELD